MSLRPNNKAFTLVELMVVIVIIGIMATLMIPEMQGTFQDALLRSTSRKLVDVFSLASSQAVAHSQVHRIHLDFHSSKFQLEKHVRRGGIEEFVPVDEFAGSQGQWDPRITIRVHESSAEPTPSADDAPAMENSSPATPESPLMTDNDVISFSADGTSDSREFELRDRSGFGLILRLNPVTSAVHILEVSRE